MRIVCILGVLAVTLSGGTEPRASASAYAAQARAAHGEFGAEFTGRAIDVGKDSFYTGDYLVFEVALFVEKGGLPLSIAPGDFRLRLNNATREWSTATAASVAASIRNPDLLEHPRGVVAGGGIGQGSIIVGGPRTAERFPGDPQGRVSNRPQVQGGQDPVEAAAQAAGRYALESTKAGPSGVSGLVYFYWRGKIKDLKRIELVYEGDAGKAVLKLR